MSITVDAPHDVEDGALDGTTGTTGMAAGDQRVYVPRDLHAAFAAITRRRQHRQKALLHHWVITAALVADRGRGDELPRIRSLPGGRAAGQGVKVPWTQHPDEYRRCYDRIRAAGSSVAVVIRAGIADYVEHDGDLFAVTFLVPRDLR